MNKHDYDDLIIPSNTGGPPLIPIGFLDHGEVVYFLNGCLAVNLGGGWLRVSRRENIRGIECGYL